jgi:hypothetical protein
MASHLTHASNQSEDVGIVVQDRAVVEVGAELALDIGVKRGVKLLLFFGKVVTSDGDDSRRQRQIIGTLHFGATKHHAVQE